MAAQRALHSVLVRPSKGSISPSSRRGSATSASWCDASRANKRRPYDADADPDDADADDAVDADAVDADAAALSIFSRIGSRMLRNAKFSLRSDSSRALVAARCLASSAANASSSVMGPRVLRIASPRLRSSWCKSVEKSDLKACDRGGGGGGDGAIGKKHELALTSMSATESTVKHTARSSLVSIKPLAPACSRVMTGMHVSAWAKYGGGDGGGGGVGGGESVA